MKYFMVISITLFFLSCNSHKKIIENNIPIMNFSIKDIEKLPMCERGDYYTFYAEQFKLEKKYQEALKYYKKSLKLINKCDDLARAEDAYIYYPLSEITELLGDRTKEEKYYYQSIEYIGKAIYQIESLVGNRDMSLYQLYMRLSKLLYKISNYKKSYYFSNKYINFYKRDKDLLFTVLTKSEKYNYNKQVLEGIDLYLSTSHHINKEEDIKQLVFENWINFKGSVNAHENALHSLKYFVTNNQKLSVKEKNSFLLKLKELKKYKRQYSIAQQIEEKNKIDAIESEFSEKVINYKEYLGLKELDTNDIQTILEKQNALYIDFARTDKNYYIFTMDRFGQLTFDEISEVKTKDIDMKIDDFRKQMNIISNNNGKINKNVKNKTINNMKLTLSKLYKDIFPLALKSKLSNLKSNTSLIISPDAKLNFLPFEALVMNNGECLIGQPSKERKCISDKSYLIEKFKVKYIPSAKELVRLDKFNSIKKKNTKNIAFLNPNFYEKMPNSERNGILGTTVTKSCQESILELSDLDTRLTKSLSEKIKPTIYRKEEASEENLLAQSNIDILDITTHGLYCENKETTDPMLKTMLVLTGAKASIKKGNKDSFDGIVTALEISSMNLEGTKLVTLSACQTGLGEIRKGEGVASINKAFIQAGARNVISTLWSVAQTETGELMHKFYDKRDVVDNPSDALREAKIEMIKRHPYFWSGFVLYGE